MGQRELITVCCSQCAIWVCNWTAMPCALFCNFCDAVGCRSCDMVRSCRVCDIEVCKQTGVCSGSGVVCGDCGDRYCSSCAAAAVSTGMDTQCVTCEDALRRLTAAEEAEGVLGSKASSTICPVCGFNSGTVHGLIHHVCAGAAAMTHIDKCKVKLS